MASRNGTPASSKDPSNTRSTNTEEARHLAEEALEERRHGNEEEAKFVLEEARELDKRRWTRS